MVSQSILRLPAVSARTGLSRSTIYAAIARKEFPAPIAIGARSVGWLETEVQAFIEQRIAASRSDSSQQPCRS